MNSFTYQDANWKVFGIVNDGTVLKELKVKEEFKRKLSGFLSDYWDPRLGVCFILPLIQ